MPQYQYECDDRKGGCGHKFEKVLSMDDREKPLNKPCPECKAKGTVIKLVGDAKTVDPGVINADKNMERSGVLDNLNRIKEHHPVMKWKG